jgi:hypothetical protein
MGQYNKFKKYGFRMTNDMILQPDFICISYATVLLILTNGKTYRNGLHVIYSTNVLCAINAKIRKGITKCNIYSLFPTTEIMGAPAL